MAFRFWRRIKLAPGVTLNLSKSTGSLSFGPRGGKFTLSPRGHRATAGLTGTGLFYTHRFSKGSGRDAGRRRRAEPDAPRVPVEDRLDLGFFRRLFTPDDEEALVDGCRELALGHESKAAEHLRRATHLADGAYLAGFLALRRDRPDEAIEHLSTAAEQGRRLGSHFRRYGISAVMSMAITEEVTVHVGPDLRGVLLGLVEAHQQRGQREGALRCARRLRRLEPDDVLVRLSMAELWWEGRDAGRSALQRIVELGAGVENETALHAALMLYRGRALHELQLLEAARDSFTAALRRRKDRPDDLRRRIRYERARVYEDMGRRSRAREELGKVYAEEPGFEDVATRLGFDSA